MMTKVEIRRVAKCRQQFMQPLEECNAGERTFSTENARFLKEANFRKGNNRQPV